MKEIIKIYTSAKRPEISRKASAQRDVESAIIDTFKPYQTNAMNHTDRGGGGGGGGMEKVMDVPCHDSIPRA